MISVGRRQTPLEAAVDDDDDEAVESEVEYWVWDADSTD